MSQKTHYHPQGVGVCDKACGADTMRLYKGSPCHKGGACTENCYFIEVGGGPEHVLNPGEKKDSGRVHYDLYDDASVSADNLETIVYDPYFKRTIVISTTGSQTSLPSATILSPVPTVTVYPVPFQQFYPSAYGNILTRF
jgi:hypothetical protein